MYAEDIYIAATEMCGEESELLGLFSAAAEMEFRKKLRHDVLLEDIKPLFVAASAMLACSMYSESCGAQVKSWRIGQVSVSEGESSMILRDRAVKLLAEYCDLDSGFAFSGVNG